MTIGCCTCLGGNAGGYYKHQSAVEKVFQIPRWRFMPVVDPDMCRLLHIVATGNTYCLVKDGDECTAEQRERLFWGRWRGWG